MGEQVEDMDKLYETPIDMQTTIFDQVDNYLHMVNSGLQHDEKEDEHREHEDAIDGGASLNMHLYNINDTLNGVSTDNGHFDMVDLHFGPTLTTDDDPTKMAELQHTTIHHGHLDVNGNRSDSLFSPFDSPLVHDTPSLEARNSIQLTNEGSTSALTTPFLSGKNHYDDHGNSINSQSFNYHNRNSSLSKVSGKFSPISSPALTSTNQEQQHWNTSSRRASNSSSRSKRVLPSGNSSVSSTSNKVIKNSPYMNASSRRLQKTISNGNSKRDEWDEFMFSLPESSLANDLTTGNDENMDISLPAGHSPTKEYNSYPKVILPSHAAENESMETDNYERASLLEDSQPDETQNNNPQNNNPHSNGSSISPVGKNDSVMLASGSPVLKPQNSSSNILQTPYSSKRVFKSPADISSTEQTADEASNNASNDAKSKDKKQRKPSSSGPNKLKRTNTGGSIGRVRSDSASQNSDYVQRKKEVHKYAEQERRNRLNNALSDLNSLLPQDWKDAVTVPSKAITAELACKYIRTLLEELEQYKK